jgi:hypothetical protein
MNCPNCNTPNDPANQFCVNCGKPLSEQAVPPPQPTFAQTPAIARSVSELLQVLTIRMLVILLGLWLLRAILNWLPFIKELRIPNSPVPIPTIINTLIYLIIIAWLVSYSRTLWVLWPQALPRFREAGSFLVMLIYIIILVIFYYAVRPLISILDLGTEVLTILQVALFIIALVLLLYAIIVIYQRLPFWLPALRQSAVFKAPTGNEVACLNCGTLNKAGAAFCSSCGQALTKAKA